MTEKLYYTDSYCFEFTAKIIDIVAENDHCAIILDKTAFFPEGGGQKADIGFIKNKCVYDVIEKNEIIYHYVNDINDIFVGEYVDCKVDADLRFARMQAHTGEHIVSGVAHHLFGVDNVGFHMDDLVMTVDFNKVLSKEDVALIEITSNRQVYENKRVTTHIFEVAELQNINYRSKIDFQGPARIVEIDGVDMCACCAPHVRSTGEIGLIKILSCVSHRGGVRLTMICGMAAFNDYVEKYRQTLNISALLCAKHNETDTAVERLLDQNYELKNRCNYTTARMLDYIASGISEKDIILESFTDFTMDELRELANRLKQKSKLAIVLLSGNDDNGYSYCIYSEKFDLKAFVKDFNISLNGTGGGRAPIVQGKVVCTISSVNEFIKNLKVNTYENA